MSTASSQSSLELPTDLQTELSPELQTELPRIATSSFSTFGEEGLTTAQKKLGTDKIDKVPENYVEVQFFNFEKKCHELQNLFEISNAVFDSHILIHSIGKICVCKFCKKNSFRNI